MLTCKSNEQQNNQTSHSGPVPDCLTPTLAQALSICLFPTPHPAHPWLGRPRGWGSSSEWAATTSTSPWTRRPQHQPGQVQPRQVLHPHRDWPGGGRPGHPATGQHLQLPDLGQALPAPCGSRGPMWHKLLLGGPTWGPLPAGAAPVSGPCPHLHPFARGAVRWGQRGRHVGPGATERGGQGLRPVEHPWGVAGAAGPGRRSRQRAAAVRAPSPESTKRAKELDLPGLGQHPLFSLSFKEEEL